MDREKIAIERLITASEMSLQHYGKPLIITYSSGKDSEVLLELAKRSGILFEVNNNHTTADAPETVYHIRRAFHDLELEGIKCKINYPKLSMWQLIVKNGMPPTRLVRYCCKYLKENNCQNSMIATGVRWSESVKRAKTRGVYEDFNSNKNKRIILTNDNDDRRRLIERCEIKARTVVNPIINWSNAEIWDFYNNECKYRNPLYDNGFERIGCIGCPMAGKKRYREFYIYPKYKNLYIKAFDRMLEVRKAKDRADNWKTGYDVFRWWMGEDPNQLTLFNEEEQYD